MIRKLEKYAINNKSGASGLQKIAAGTDPFDQFVDR